MRTVIIQMISDIVEGSSVSREEIAAHLGKSITQFNNCLYQTNGQEFKVHELLEIQNHYGVTHFTDYVCKSTGQEGGVYVPAPDTSLIDKTEMYDIAMEVQKSNATLDLYFTQSVADGVITDAEYQKLKVLLLKLYKSQNNHLVHAQIIYGDAKNVQKKRK